ncbi:MAG: carbohydrate binding domain-containing protein [bacterium]|jgi:hypothetical protein|nr:carbohydrate binding domain-containing protein [bacterium]
MSRSPFAGPTLTLFTLALLVALGGLGCGQSTSIVRNQAIGNNGSFEHDRSGRPVNWHVHQKAVKKSRTELSLDKTEVRDGGQSLKFSVGTASGNGAGESPGIYQDFATRPNRTYRVSFWLKNNQTRFKVFVTGLSPKTTPTRQLVLSEEGLEDDWSQFNVNHTTTGAQTAIRFELNITGPGTLWIDGVEIQEVDGN